MIEGFIKQTMPQVEQVEGRKSQTQRDHIEDAKIEGVSLFRCPLSMELGGRVREYSARK